MYLKNQIVILSGHTSDKAALGRPDRKCKPSQFCDTIYLEHHLKLHIFVDNICILILTSQNPFYVIHTMPYVSE